MAHWGLLTQRQRSNLKEEKKDCRKKPTLYHYSPHIPAILQSRELRCSAKGCFGAGAYFMPYEPSRGRNFLAKVAYDKTGQHFASGDNIGYIAIAEQELKAWVAKTGTLHLWGPLETGDGAQYKVGWKAPPDGDWEAGVPPIPLGDLEFEFADTLNSPTFKATTHYQCGTWWC
eukprot:TRINITY_DN112815_c0_g1_i1.p1 TRINITY_DN112815_c0_g1~~TRINITY_DN112815_c0_g1_i1.p1  ORF type:complete len:173 (-),score=23.24 TRINITY_DN112815_c0_g1_i1:115-633(-)